MPLIAGLVGFMLLDPPWGALALAAGAAIEVGEYWLWIRYLDRFRVKTGAEGLLGERATVTGACRPRGMVRAHGELWSAECEAGAAVGEEVVVREVRGLTLVVEPAGDQSG
jgi:membrane protein implicated in regulation of membrane protease activity